MPKFMDFSRPTDELIPFDESAGEVVTVGSLPRQRVRYLINDLTDAIIELSSLESEIEGTDFDLTRAKSLVQEARKRLESYLGTIR